MTTAGMMMVRALVIVLFLMSTYEIAVAELLIPLDVVTVTTGGVAVTAFLPGHRIAGGWIQNPSTASTDLCVNEIGTATGTTSNGSTTCISPGASYTLMRSANAVSVISSDSSHPFSGVGYN